MGSPWLEHIVERYAASGPVVWVETNQTVEIATSQSNVHVLSVADDPFGWNVDGGSTLENLEALLIAIVEAAGSESSIVVFESMTPILMRHGLDRTIRFVKKVLATLKSPLVLPVLVDSLSAAQHRLLEDMAHATLFLHGGNLNLIRQGVRERGNIVRENVPFRVEDSSGKPMIRVQQNDDDIQDEDEPAVVVPTPTIAPQLVTMPQKPQSTVARFGKIKLQMEEDASTTAPSQVNEPNIFIQDDDPEYDDLDEEDPDDDLDI
jgi:hypothetical protein